MSKWLYAMLLPAITLPSPASAQEQRDDAPRPLVYRRLMECRTLAEPQQRLTCFDNNAAAFEEAARRREIVISDKDDVKRARRGLFGFAAPVGKLMGFGGDEDDAEQIKEITTSVSEARKGSDGWHLHLRDGSSWEQNDTRDYALSPKAGDPVRITRGALGTYFISVKSQRALRMRRIK